MDIGFIGLGHMGAGIAANLVKAGHRVRVWNRSAEPVTRLAAVGAQKADSAAAAFDADLTFSMLANDEAIEQVILTSGALDLARKAMVHVNLATVSVALAGRLTRLHQQRWAARMSPRPAN
jgi:3-hydroxyisobutyrate dehydrogenase-like beta-hydroxyacid dehydrogenase